MEIGRVRRERTQIFAETSRLSLPQALHIVAGIRYCLGREHNVLAHTCIEMSMAIKVRYKRPALRLRDHGKAPGAHWNPSGGAA